MTLNRTVALLLSIMCISSAFAQEVGFLDLSTESLPQSSRHFVTGTVSGGTNPSNRPASAPFSVKLIAVDREQASVGDEVTFEITVTNNGEKPIILPWNPAIRDFELPQVKTYKYSHAYVFLTLESKGILVPFVGGIHLYGSPTVHGSLQHLAPGQWVRVRGKAVLQPALVSSDKTKAISVSNEPQKIRANLTLDSETVTATKGGYHSDSVPLDPIVRSNYMDIVITP